MVENENLSISDSPDIFDVAANGEQQLGGQLKFQKVIDLSERTRDVIADDSPFDSLMINDEVKERLKRYGYVKPSPVQIEAIPMGLMGNDLLVQAKSGTGKTLVFSIIAAETLISQEFLRYTPRVLAVAPTREIAIQIAGTIKQIVPENNHYATFIGGTPVDQDRELLSKGIQVAIGTSGRLCQLVKQRALNLSQVNLFILDEADKLMESDFQMEINYLFSSCPREKQVCVFSATYPHKMDQLLCKYMNSPILIRLCAEDVQLLGIKQYAKVALNNDLLDELCRVLTMTYSQCLVFVNEIEKVPLVVERLREAEHKVAGISSAMDQDERNRVMKDLKKFKIRVLVSSDLTARGIDASQVNLVISLECPVQDETYLHRIGRAGRYGGHGAAITILTQKNELTRFKGMAKRQKLKVRLLKSKFPQDLTTNTEFFDKSEALLKKKKKKLDQEEEEDDSQESAYEQVYLNKDTSSSTLTALDDPPIIDKNAPLKFIPSRKANKRQYYLKRELQTIVASLSTETMNTLFRGMVQERYDELVEDGLIRGMKVEKKTTSSDKSTSRQEKTDSETNQEDIQIPALTKEDIQPALTKEDIQSKLTREEVYEAEIRRAKQLLGEDNYRRHMKLAECLRKRSCLKESKSMELKAESLLYP